MENEFKKAVDLYEIGKISDAKKICTNIYKKNPKHFDNLRLLNFIYFKEKKFSKALSFINEAIKINPNFAETYNVQGNTLNELKQLNQAIISYDKAIKINPNFSNAYYNKGLVLHELKNTNLAIENYKEAIKINPNFFQAYNNMGFAFHQLKRFDESLKSYEKAFAINPNSNFLLGKIIHSKNFLCEWKSHKENLKNLTDQLENNKASCLPFATLSLFDSPRLQKKAAELWIQETFPKNNIPEKIKKYKSNKKIKLGYYSADYHNHATSFLIAELMELHNKSKFELFGFSFGPNKQDEMRKRVSSSFDQFIDVRFKSDYEIVELSRKLEIDIAVDLKGITTDSRFGIFLKRCAPIQINFLGYPGTLGTSTIDYILADKILISKKNQKNFFEKIIYMPNSYQPNDTKKKISKKNFTRKEMGLPKNSFVFCCFNQNYKITPDVYDIWMKLLKKIDGSVLWLMKNSEKVTENLKKEAIKRNIKSNRIIFAEKMPLAEHLARHKLADLFIDTFPYNAHTTCSDALWSGLPVITRMGESFASRVGASLLSAIELNELITKSEKEYEKLAIKLATNPKLLNKIKNKLKKNKVLKPLFNTKLYTSNIELAYTKIYNNYYSNLPIKNIEIK
tara:strand:- start:116 stop:1984 length:1869 start_codon:yes stop_codon:yes gene_type:complete